MRDRHDLHGRLTLMLHDRDGALALLRRQPNLIVTSGRRLVAEMLGGRTTGPPRTPVSAIAIGTDGTPPKDDDPALKAQRGRAKPITRVEYAEFTDGEGVRRVRVQCTVVFDFDEGNDPNTALREAGLLNDAGVLYSRIAFKDVTKTDTFQLTLLWDLVF